VAVATLGAFVVVAGVLGIVSLYLGAVTQVLSGVQRTSPLPDYVGRPTPTAANPDNVRPMRYLVLVNDADGTLASAYLAQLSGHRNSLHLIGLPANLLVTDLHGRDATLASRFAAGSAEAVRSIESLLGLRVDHLVMLELSGFTRVIDVVGGVTVQNRMETAADGWHFGAGELRLNGTEASVFLGSSKQSMWTLERTQAVFVEIVRGIVGGDALTNPAKVETIGQVLRTCVTVDAALTPGEIRRMALDVHLTSDAINGTPLPLAGVSDMNGSPVIVADAARLPELTDALTSDDIATWADKQDDPWAPLADLPPR